MATVPASEHESFMHPVACVLVASGSEEDPVWALRSLQNHAAVHRVQTQSFSDGNMLFYYMLVHDGRDAGVLQAIDHKFDQVRRAFGQNSALLKINSSTDLIDADAGDRGKISGIWTSSLATTQPLAAHPDAVYGGMLTMRDVAAIRDAVKQMMVRSVVPHMQYLIRVLSDQTANQRRGITGRLFSAGRRYFGTAAKATSTLVGADGDVYFRYDSPEAQMRKLADYSFMLKDFRFAQSVYQVARRDFQSEKAWRSYAGAQEMVGVCKLMLEVQATKAEFDGNFEDAVAVYLHKTHLPCPHLAIRATFIYYELLKHHGLYAFAPGALLRLPASLGALHAMACEQAAYAFLKHPHRPELRKFSFHAMLAGQGYQRADIGGLAHRCLRMVRQSLGASLYDPNGFEEAEKRDGHSAEASAERRPLTRSKWSAIDSYVNHELGTQCMAAQSYEQALQYFMALMDSDQISPKLQAKYLQELLQLYLERSDKAGAPELDASPHGRMELSVPAIDAQMIRVIMSPELEGEDGVLGWRHGGPAPERLAASGSGLCCSAGEDVAVLVVVKNPLTIGITLNSFMLDCEFAAPADAEHSESPAFAVSTVDSVALEGGQTAMVSVSITPQRAGHLTIRGASYLLCDILPAYRALRLPGKRLDDTKEQRLTATYAADTRLGFTVDPSYPRLDAVLEEFPDTLVSGSMQRAQIRLTNRGALACQSIALWLSHPSFFDVASPRLVGSSDEGESDLDDTGAQSTYVYSESVPATEEVLVANVLQDCSMFVLAGQAILSDGSSVAAGSGALAPADALEPGASLLVPVWIRGDRVGAHALSLIVGASTAQPASALASKAGSKLRSRRFDIDLVVTPSLRVNAFVRPSLRDPHERIVGVEVENVQTDLDVRLVQTTFTSGYFELVPLSAVCDPADGGAAREVNVGPRQTVNLMYRARPHRAAAVGPVRAEPELFTIGALQQYIFSKDKPTALPEPIRLVYSSTVLGERGIDCVHSALQGYISRAQAHRRRNMLRSAYPLLPEKLQPALFPLYETFGIDFVLFWSENGGRRTGHHSITGIDLGVPHDYIVEALNPPRTGVARTWLKDTLQERETLIQSIASRAAAARRSERPLDVVIKLAGVGRQGTAGSDGMTAADVDVTVYNHSWRHGYDVALQLVSPSEIERLAAAGVKLEHPGPRSAWSWVGTTKHSLSVPPLGSVSVRAQVACSASGIIDVALWELSATAVDPQLALETPAAHAADGQHWSTSRECRLRPLHPSFINVAAE